MLLPTTIQGLQRSHAGIVTAGNILVKRGASGAHELVPIDHGYVLPDSFQDISFEWLYWPQARAPLGEWLRDNLCSDTPSASVYQALAPWSPVI